jgi:hypothetical protein
MNDNNIRGFDVSKSLAECQEIINSRTIKDLISDYVAFRCEGKIDSTNARYREWSEEYKWDILPKLNAIFPQGGFLASNIIEKIDILQKQNPSKGSFVHWSNLDSLRKLAAKDPNRVSKLIGNILNDNVPINISIDNFCQQANEIDKNLKLGTPLFGYIAASYDCNKYPLYKGEVFSYIKKICGKVKEWNSLSIGMKYEKFSCLCLLMGEYLNQNNLLKETLIKGVKVSPGNIALDGQDFFYVSAARADTKETGDDSSVSNDVADVQVCDLLKAKKQIILYGPPGTGKTYNTKKYSVNLLEGIEEAIDPLDYISESEETGPSVIEKGDLFNHMKAFIMSLANVTEKPRSSMEGYYSLSRMNNKKRGLAWVAYPATDKSLRVWVRKEVYGKYPADIKSMPGYKENGWGGYPEFKIANNDDAEKAKIFIKFAYEKL